MKITHVLWELRIGGAENILVDIVNRQCMQHEVEIIMINTDFEEAIIAMFDKRIRLIRIGRHAGSRNPWYILKLNLLIACSGSDIIHCHQDNIIRYLPVRLFKKNICLTVHSVRIEASYIPKYNYLFAITNEVSDCIKRETGIEAPVVMNGVDIKRFRQQKNKQNKIFRIVQIGRLVHSIKGQDLSLAAIHLLVNKYKYTNLHLDIIGWGNSEKYLKDMAESLNLTDYVSFLGTCDREYIGERLTDYDLLVQPSRWEGFGLTIVEAMSALTPTLLSNIDGGMQTVSQQGKYAYTFQSENVEDYAQKLYEITQLPDKEREKLAQEAYNYALEHFDISANVNNYLFYYKKIIKNESTRP